MALSIKQQQALDAIQKATNRALKAGVEEWQIMTEVEHACEQETEICSNCGIGICVSTEPAYCDKCGKLMDSLDNIEAITAHCTPEGRDLTIKAIKWQLRELAGTNPTIEEVVF